jgi:hypothetical protein
MIDTTDGRTREQHRYLAQVAARLADLPGDERDELLEELRQHLRDVAEGGDGELEEQLGPADSFAAELRASAGLAVPSGTAGRGLVGAARALDRSVIDGFRTRWDSVRAHPEVAASVEGLRRAAPLGWALRGYLGVLAFDVLQGGQYQLWSFPFPAFGGSRVLGFGLGLAGAAASVGIGRAVRRGSAPLRMVSRILSGAVAVGLFLVALAIGNAATITVPHAHAEYVDEGPLVEDEGYLLSPTGEPITNLHPYGLDGQPLEGVLLYDQDGRPVDLVVEHLPDGRRIVTSYPLDADGTPVTNAFPQRQVLRPDAYAGSDPGGPDPTRTPTVRDVPTLAPTAEDTDTDTDSGTDAGAADTEAPDDPVDGDAEAGSDERAE